MDHLLVKKEPERERISRSKNRRKEANCTRKKGSKYLVSSNADASTVATSQHQRSEPTYRLRRRGARRSLMGKTFRPNVLDVVKIVTFSTGRKKNFLRA